MANPPKRRGRHRAEEDRRSPVLMTMTSAALAASIATGFAAGMANAVPHQGGTSPSDTAPQQGGTTPEAEPAPQQGGTTPTPDVAPVNVPGPGTIPGPPQEAPYQPYVEPSTYTAPTYEDAYNPVPQGPLTAPKPVAPVRPIAPPPDKIRVGNYITDIPEGMSDKDVNSINAWAAYGEAKIAQGLISIGVPEDEATRQAASTIIGVALGGTAGAAVGAVPGGIAGAAVGLPVGAAVGAIYNAVVFPYLIGPTGGGIVGLGAAAGAGIGLGVGAAAGAAAGAATGALIGGTAGGALAYALGAGDPGANPDEPWKQGRPDAEPLPNPDANQFELELAPEDAQKAGLPSVSYVVNSRGDVHASINGMEANWTVEQALAPYGLLGVAGPQAEKSAQQATKQRTDQAQNANPDLYVAWPQEAAPQA
ncbi:hypothetical protein ACIGKQ_13240 [Gordonia sp. NPDC062954]|uniref:Uncharacterized protein n=1 Tax=Gordonia aquimaris TaxID=2984863 RepID=A0A9X3I5U4_9ACTN|nr:MULTISPECIES: hypothetical protein [Gordonia]MAU82969.1 hypothetical protein [Gordonia sp. (in: high G+C Gram-positive bacteria)]MCX2964859.1 hypothetical protein [Gordonia aquimaris]